MPDWLPHIFTFLLGFGTKWLTDWVQHRRTLEREREARQATRRDEILERRAAFQRETLLALQEAMADLARAAGRISHLHTMSVRTTGKTQRLPDDLDEGYRLATVRADLLGVRVRDAQIRELVTSFRQSAVDCTMAKAQEDCDRALAETIETQFKLNERIGEVLRTLDDETDSLIAR